LAGQAHNDAGYNDLESESFFKAVKLMHGNTLTIPVYWLQVEPEEGKFDFTAVDALIASAAIRGQTDFTVVCHLENGNMDYTRHGLKKTKSALSGCSCRQAAICGNLSAHCKESLEADKKSIQCVM